MEQPFGENEVRYFLAEILKNSSIAPSDLMNLIQERGIQPSWYEIALPNGRSVNSCLGVWQNLQANAQANAQARLRNPVQPVFAFEQSSPQSAPPPKRRRPASGEGIAMDRTIQAQQPINFPPINVPGDPSTDQGATASNLEGPPKKKRGRPSKAEYEAKVAEAAARGEEYQPPPKRKKTPRTSLEGAPNPYVVTDVGAVGEDSPNRKKARKLKPAPEEASSRASGPAVRNPALEATAHAAGQMQSDEARAVQSTVPETQASEVEARENLLAGTREHVEHTAPDTVQSTMALRQDPTPRNTFTSYQGPTRDPPTTGEQRFL